jgi:hypothetical protein
MKPAVPLAITAFAAMVAGFASCASSSKSEVAPVGASAPQPVNVERAAAPPPSAPSAPVAATPPSAPDPTVDPAAAPVVAAAPAAPVPAASDYRGPDPCTMATKGDSPVARACRENGVKGAKVAMKEMLKVARSNGVRFQCDDCHINDTDYAQLGQGAEDKFARLLAATTRK